MATEIKPLKQFGQNFLKNTDYSEKIVAALNCQSVDTILEIGAGTGALTNVLINQKYRQIITLEIDRRLADRLAEKYGSAISVINKSILDFSINEIADKSRIKVVGNIPYNITSDIIFKIIDNHVYIKRAVIMIQKEVADRLIAKTRTKEYGILTIFSQCHAKITKLFDVSRENFYPKPQVDSSVISFDLFEQIKAITDYHLFKKLVRVCFQNRRKMIRNSLRKFVNNQDIDRIKSVKLTARPEELSVQDFKNLSNEISGFRLV